MTSAEELLRLHEAGSIDIALQGRFLEAPEPVMDLDFARIEGMLLGIAIGDALGNTTESQRPHQRLEERGEIRDYLPNPHADDRPVGLPSDDSQMTFWTLEHLLEHGSLEPNALTKLFASRPIFGMGATVGEALGRFLTGTSWDSCGVSGGAGNGALMRIAPVLIPHLKTGGDRGSGQMPRSPQWSRTTARPPSVQALPGWTRSGGCYRWNRLPSPSGGCLLSSRACDPWRASQSTQPDTGSTWTNLLDYFLPTPRW